MSATRRCRATVETAQAPLQRDVGADETQICWTRSISPALRLVATLL